MAALERLAEEIGAACAGGWVPSETKVGEWHQLVQAAIAEVGGQWMSEQRFRAYSGRGVWWCREHFTEYVETGLARQRGRRREWSRQASPPRHDAVDEDEIIGEIVSSYKGAA